jgi:hypothetical protein
MIKRFFCATLPFINRVVNATEDVAIALTGNPDHEVRARLQKTRVNLERDLSKTLGLEAAAVVADAFCRAVLGEKAEREMLASINLLR